MRSLANGTFAAYGAAETAGDVLPLIEESILVPDAGHYPQSQRPDVVARAIARFLGEEVGRGPGRTHA